MMEIEKLFETVTAHAKNSGFVFQGSEIYGGLSNTWDFGPLGIELKDNIKRAGEDLFKNLLITPESSPLF